MGDRVSEFGRDIKLAADLEDLEGEIALADPTRTRAGDFMELVKARLNMMVLITTMIGFVVGTQMLAITSGEARAIDWWLLMQTLIGTGLCAAGASALNQVWEYKFDAMMSRTADRPVAAGRMKPGEATVFGLLMCVCGTVALALSVNLVSAALALSTILLYVLVYTPMKRWTTLNTLVGAIPGAIPPVIGYAAVTGRLDLEAAALFLILFCWQMPHFLAIAILCRDDYAAAGYKMMPVVDPTLRRTSVWIVAFGVLLIAASLLPVWSGPTSIAYVVVALLLGKAFLATGLRCAILQTRPAARLAFFGSIVYLPLALGALMIDRLL
jgi:heme o synthase